MSGDLVINELKIQKAALNDDWDSVNQMFQQDQELMTKRIISYSGETPLIVAIKTNRSNCFVKKLIDAVGEADKLFVTGKGRNNPLHYAAQVGNTYAARLLVERKPDMTLSKNFINYTPLLVATLFGKKETLEYLLEVTKGDEEGGSPFTGSAGWMLIARTIDSGLIDVALHIVRMHPDILREHINMEGTTLLDILARKPRYFPSGSRLRFIEHLIYSLIHVRTSKEATQVNNISSILSKVTASFWSALRYIAPGIKNIHDKKIRHIRSNQLLNHIMETVIHEKVDSKLIRRVFGSALEIGIVNGTYELIKECATTYPGILSYRDKDFNSFLDLAIRERQEQVYNLVLQMSEYQLFASYNALNMAAQLAPTNRLEVVTGAALQMQRELQWFKEVEKNLDPSRREIRGQLRKDLRMRFSDEHKGLLKEATNWMKDTATSCTVVGALIVTVAFAAAFTVPGGNQDNGKPFFQNNKTFMLFIISDAVALFSSSTSVLMFLGILTSRFAEEDFLYALPKRLTIGLFSLFMSLAATMIAFSATFALVLLDKAGKWIAAPLVVATNIPVLLYGILQFPLLVELVYSTYGPSIFQKQSPRVEMVGNRSWQFFRRLKYFISKEQIFKYF